MRSAQERMTKPFIDDPDHIHRSFPSIPVDVWQSLVVCFRCHGRPVLRASLGSGWGSINGLVQHGGVTGDVIYDRSTALLVVDVQNDFSDPAGSLYVRGGEEIVPVLNVEIGRAAGAGALVVYTQDWHPPRTPHFAPDGGPWPVHCVADTWGAAFHPDLDVVGPSIRKGTSGEDGYSGFTMAEPATGAERATGLERLLRDNGITKVVVGGLATDYCVKETGLDARRAGFQVIVLHDAIRAVEVAAGDGERAVRALTDAGAQIA
jgi:nicotinamidase/pyrazinamidase